MTVKAYFCQGTTVAEKAKLLRKHPSARTGHTRPLSVLDVVAFCDRLLCLQPPDSDGLVSIEAIRYVQASHANPQSTMKKWIDSVTWKPVSGGLTSKNKYMTNMHKFEDPNDE